MSIEMNSQSVNVEASIIDTKSNAARKPKLSAKLEKQMIFGCWFLQHLVDQNVLADAAQLSRARNELKMFENLEAQTAFYENFETNMAAIQKVTRKEIADFHKPPKAPKAPRAKKATADAEGGGVAEPKRGRKKKVVETVVDTNKDFIEQLVAVANARSAEQVAAIVSESTSNISNVEPEVTQIIPITNITQVSEQVKEKKPRKKAEPKAKESVVAEVVSAPVIAEVVAAVVVSEPVKAAPKKRAAPKKKEANVVAPIALTTTDEPVVVAAVAKADEPVKEKAAPKKKAEPKAKVDTKAIEAAAKAVEEARAAAELKAIEEARASVELKALEEARQAFEREEARQAEILAAKNEAELEDDDDDTKSHHTVELPRSDDEEEEEEEEIQAREFVLDGKHYLIDENTNEVYDHETQELIGTFDKASNMIIAAE